MIKHHLSSEILLSYAAGNTSAAESLIVASHLTFCHKCRKELELYEKLGGNFLKEVKSVEFSSSSLDNVLSKIDIDDNIVFISNEGEISSILANGFAEQLSAPNMYSLEGGIQKLIKEQYKLIKK